jgi:hypothetical protein
MEALLTANFNIWILLKTLSLVLLGMYLIFSLVVLRQVRMMTDTLQLGFEAPIKALAYLHMAFAILVFVSALVIL